MKNLFFIVLLAYGLVGCEGGSINPQLQCNSGFGDRTLIINNVTYREEIRAAMMDCMKGNSNRDVVYNDTNELAKTCKKMAFSLYGGVDTRGNESYYGSIENSLYECGELTRPTKNKGVQPE